MKNFKKPIILTFLGLTTILFLFLTAGCKEEAVSQHSSPQKSAAHPALPDEDTISGKVVETMDSGGYTYVLLESNGRKIWVAMPQTPVTVGQEIELAAGHMMTNFTSKTLNRTFDTIIFSPGLKGARSNPHAGMMSSPHGSSSGSQRISQAPEKNLKIEKAQGPNGYTVAEIFDKKADLAGKKIQVRGKVVKVSKNIMGMNWVHIQDGTGDPSKGNFDLVVTTQDEPQKGDIVTVEGTVHADKDFGAGYRYDVIVQEAKIKK